MRKASPTARFLATYSPELNVSSAASDPPKKEGLFNNFITQEILPCTQRVLFTITENFVKTTPKLVANNSFVCQNSNDEFMVEGAEQTATFTWTSPKGTNVVGTGSKISLSSTITGQTDTLRVTVMDNQACGTDHKLKIPVTFITVPTTANLVIKGNTTNIKLFLMFISDFMFSVGVSIHILLCGVSG